LPTLPNYPPYYEQDVYINKRHPKPFGECVNKGILDMLKNSNHTFEQARQAIIAEYNHWITHFTEGEGANNFMTINVAANLRYNRDGLRLLGDAEATL
jgi:hypothetical protein